MEKSKKSAKSFQDILRFLIRFEFEGFPGYYLYTSAALFLFVVGFFRNIPGSWILALILAFLGLANANYHNRPDEQPAPPPPPAPEPPKELSLEEEARRSDLEARKAVNQAIINKHKK